MYNLETSDNCARVKLEKRRNILLEPEVERNPLVQPRRERDGYANFTTKE